MSPSRLYNHCTIFLTRENPADGQKQEVQIGQESFNLSQCFHRSSVMAFVTICYFQKSNVKIILNFRNLVDF